MTTALDKLRSKLCRELAQSEHDAIVHCEREAERYGAHAPGELLRDIADHARSMRPRLDALWGRQLAGVRVGRAVGAMFSAMRHFAFDWFIDAERSYRATLLGLRHGLGAARLVREVARRQFDTDGLRVCDALVDERTKLLERAEVGLRWFADHPELALRSSRLLGVTRRRHAPELAGGAR